MTLAKLGASVYFLNPPNDSMTSVEVKEIDSHPGLYVVSAKKVAAGLRFYPPIIRRKIEKKWLEELEKISGVVIDTIWLFENSRFFDLSFAGNRLKIYHQVDLNQTFNLKTAASTADICFCTTDLIREQLSSFNERVYKIHHGLAQRQAQVRLTEEQLEHLKRTSVKAMYIGNLEMPYLDIDLLYAVAKKFADVDFHFIGGYRDNGLLKQRCSHLPNITWWGKVDSSLILSLLEMADLLLVTYKAEHWRDQASPHKFMEYLASGKVIVSTYTDEYRDKRHLLEMVDKSVDFLGAVEIVINSLDLCNDVEKIAARQQFAMDHTYERQLSKIDDHLRANGLSALFTH